jgi:hypothetical protein
MANQGLGNSISRRNHHGGRENAATGQVSAPARRSPSHSAASFGWIRNLWRHLHRHLKIVVVILIVLVAIRISLPFAIESYVNRKLNEAHDYGGRIHNVDLQIWRGQYRIYGIEIFKRSGTTNVPFFSSPRVDLSIEWKEVIHRSLVGQVIMHRPRLNFISGPPAEETLSSKDESWDKILESLFPFDLNRLEITNGQVHFQNPHSNPPVDIYLADLQATATNLTNARDLKEELPAGVTAKCTTIGGGALDVQLQLNPLAATPTYQINCQLTNTDLIAMNNFLKAYGKFDVERGKFAMFTSVAAKDGHYDGYIKVFFDNLDVFAWEKERQKNALEIFWQAIVGTLTTTFKNQSKDSLATKIPISGAYNKTSVGVWPAVGTLLRNAFVRALVPQLDGPVTVKEVKEKAEKQEILRQKYPPTEPRKGSEALTRP